MGAGGAPPADVGVVADPDFCTDARTRRTHRCVIDRSESPDIAAT